MRGLRPVQTEPLLRVSLNKRSEPSSSVVDTDRIMKAVKRLLLKKSIKKSSNKLRNLQTPTEIEQISAFSEAAMAINNVQLFTKCRFNRRSQLTREAKKRRHSAHCG